MSARKYKVEVAPEPPAIKEVEQPNFPMHVVKISDVVEVLKREGPLPCFEDLKAEGKLVERKPGDAGKVLFFSHSASRERTHTLCISPRPADDPIDPWFEQLGWATRTRTRPRSRCI